MPPPTDAPTDAPADGSAPGPLLVIGGAEDKLRKRTILKEFVSACGGAEARIALIPTASSLGDEVVEVYDALFRRLGAGEVVPIRPESREEAHDPDLVKAVGEATGRAIRASIVSVVLLDMVMTLLFWGSSSGFRVSG